VGDIVADLSRQVLAGVYTAEPVRRVRIPKEPGSGKYRTLRIGTLCDRVLGKALDDAFKGFWEKRFLPSSYGFRPRRSTWHLLADLEVALGRTGRTVLAVDDVKSAFDTVPLDAVLDVHREALARLRQQNFGGQERERTLALVGAVLRGHDRGRRRGIDQGAPYSPAALNALLDAYHDQVMTEIAKGLLWFRYADNLAYLVRSMSEGEDVLGKVSRLLEPLGMSLKFQDGVKDIRQDRVSLLGFSLHWDGETLHLGVEPGAFTHLQQHLDEVHAAPNPTRAAREAVLAWVEAYAPAFEDGDVAGVLATAAGRGFRELVSPARLCERWRTAWGRWQACRAKAQRRPHHPQDRVRLRRRQAPGSHEPEAGVPDSFRHPGSFS
jgi:retron-type reverse transcriptase